MITVTHSLLTSTHNMKSFVALLAVVAVVAADVAHLLGPDAGAQIVKQDADVFPDKFQYSFETSNGISAQETGALKNVGQENEGIAVQGANSYTGPDGNIYSLSYTADENGYHPEGAHLPVAAPIPDYILRSLEYIKTHAPKELL